ncbi:hypothetical protein GCM10007199_38930 [Fictibacillus barbaricus]|nr:hypothetical protein GCM10007199_38930 [Fictibacillus barbaricus]
MTTVFIFLIINVKANVMDHINVVYHTKINNDEVLIVNVILVIIYVMINI